jgi:hypothetical protein
MNLVQQSMLSQLSKNVVDMQDNYSRRICENAWIVEFYVLRQDLYTAWGRLFKSWLAKYFKAIFPPAWQLVRKHGGIFLELLSGS